MELLRQIWGGFRRRKREKDSASIDTCNSFDIEILEVLVLQRGSATVIPRHASVRGSYDAKSTENLVDRQWLAEAIGLPISHDVKTEAVILWKFKGLDCTYKSRHRVPEADTRIVGNVVLWFYHNKPPDISTSDLSQFQLGLQKCLDIRYIEPENFKKKRTISWRRKSFRYPSKHSNQGTSTEPTQAIVSGSNPPEPLARRSIGDDWKLIGPIFLPGVTEAEQEHSGTFVGPSDDSVVGRPLRSEGPQELVSGTGLTCPSLIQPPEIVDSPPGRDSPESSTASTQPTVLVRPPSHSREDKEVQNDTKVPISPYPKDTRLRPGGTVAFPSQNALHGDMAKDSSQHSTETTYASSPTLYTRRTTQEAPTATDGTSVKHSTIGGTRPTPAAAGPSIPPFPKTSHSEPFCPDVGGSRLPSDETMSASSSDSSSRKFPDEYWIWDEAAKNYFHSYEEDGTIKQKWLPKEDEFL